METLIALAIGGLVLTAGFSLMTAGLKNGRTIALQQQILEDLRTSGNFISDMTAAAFYVFPPGAKLTLGTSGDYSVKNPINGTNVWTAGTDPIIALLMMPDDSTAPCHTVTSPKGCVKFMAFYPVKRSDVTANAPAAENPGKDTANDPLTWMVFSYQEVISEASARKYLQGLEDAKILNNVKYTQSKGYMLGDFINNGKFVVEMLSCLRDQNIQNTCDDTHSVSRLKFNMTSEVVTSQGKVSIPKEQLSFQTAPRNLVVR